MVSIEGVSIVVSSNFGFLDFDCAKYKSIWFETPNEF